MNVATLFLSLLVFALGGTATAAELQRSSLRILGITPGESTFSDVVRSYGEAQQWHTGDAASSEYKMCFRFALDKQTVFVEIASNSEMAGPPKNVVTDIRLISDSMGYQSAARCSTVVAGNVAFATVNGVALGMGLGDVKGILGNPSRQEDGALIWSGCVKVLLSRTDPHFEYWSKQEGCFKDDHGGWHGAPYYSACSEVSVIVKNGKVVVLQLTSIDSIC